MNVAKYQVLITVLLILVWKSLKSQIGLYSEKKCLNMALSTEFKVKTGSVRSANVFELNLRYALSNFTLWQDSNNRSYHNCRSYFTCIFSLLSGARSPGLISIQAEVSGWLAFHHRLALVSRKTGAWVHIKKYKWNHSRNYGMVK